MAKINECQSIYDRQEPPEYYQDDDFDDEMKSMLEDLRLERLIENERAKYA